MLMLRSLNLFGGTRRYHWTYTYFTDTRVPIGTTELIQIQDLSDTGVPVGTTEQIRYGQNLTKCRSTRRYYRTDQIQDRTYQIQDLSDTGVPVGTTDTRVPVGTTGLILNLPIREYP